MRLAGSFTDRGNLQSLPGNGFVGKVILQLSLAPRRHSKMRRINSGRWIKKKQTRPSSVGTDITVLGFRQAPGDGQPQGHLPHTVDEEVWVPELGVAQQSIVTGG